MFFIVEVQGCLPHVALMLDVDTGEPIHFDSHVEARTYAEVNCAWSYRIVSWNGGVV